MLEKQCSKCQEVKSIEDFYKKKRGKFGVAGVCKGCANKYSKEYNKNHPEYFKEYRNNYYNEIYKPKVEKEFKPKIKICGFCGKEFFTEHLRSGNARKYCKSCSSEAQKEKNRIRQHGKYKPKTEFEPKICPICKKEFIPQKSKSQIYCTTARGDSPCFRKSVSEKRKLIADRLNKAQREDRKNNPEKYKELDKRKSEKRRTDPKLHLNNIISTAIRRSLKNGKDGRHWTSFVDYSAQDLINHLESQFKDGMSWENQGFFGWHIDHIKPTDSFDFVSYDDPDFKECWSLSNLQPLWWQDNMRKGNRIA